MTEQTEPVTLRLDDDLRDAIAAAVSAQFTCDGQPYLPKGSIYFGAADAVLAVMVAHALPVEGAAVRKDWEQEQYLDCQKEYNEEQYLRMETDWEEEDAKI